MSPLVISAVPLDHNPVFGAMVVHLQAEAGLWIDLNALDLEAATFVDAVVPTPGPMHLAVQSVFFTAGGLEFGNDRLDVLTTRPICDEYGVGCFDDDEVVDTHQSDEPAGGVDQCVAAVGSEDVAKMGVTSFILGQDLPDGIPGA